MDQSTGNENDFDQNEDESIVLPNSREDEDDLYSLLAVAKDVSDKHWDTW